VSSCSLGHLGDYGGQHVASLAAGEERLKGAPLLALAAQLARRPDTPANLAAAAGALVAASRETGGDADDAAAAAVGADGPELTS
jgi:hypothetical protein